MRPVSALPIVLLLVASDCGNTPGIDTTDKRGLMENSCSGVLPAVRIVLSNYALTCGTLPARFIGGFISEPDVDSVNTIDTRTYVLLNPCRVEAGIPESLSKLEIRFGLSSLVTQVAGTYRAWVDDTLDEQGTFTIDKCVSGPVCR